MFSLKKFVKVIEFPLLTLSRGTARYNPRHNKNPLYKKEDKQQIEKYITYYPRKNATDSEQQLAEPSKLFRVSRIKKLKNLPYWEKRLLRDFCLFDRGAVSIVKNIPENNQRLWKIKHLVKIEPINFVNGEPTEKDINYTFLKENGDCIVIKNIECVEKRLDATEKFEKNEKNLNSEILKRDSRLKWVNNY
ncbi:hypothetical protein PVAND_013384 [Polypedilum vanderplanki]|uniref:Large ribosomal subunit protein uL30m n=1 Tax=Polypedilum vanderplanki TaxID=319348 RepID=A0A9J6CQJ1_POLVA|nr:hypothetical protein PVAND_013384 [Polypedilum vanderplanki]